MGETFQLTDSVREYLSEPAVSRAVRALVDIGDDRIPEGLLLSELREFLEAKAAAELTRYEFAIAQHDFWRAVWGSQLERSWKPVPFADLAGESVTPKACWEDKAFSLWHKAGDFILYTGVEFNEKRSLMLIGMGEVKTEAELDIAWEVPDDIRLKRIDDHDWPGKWMALGSHRNPADHDFPLDQFRNAARSLLAQANRIAGLT